MRIKYVVPIVILAVLLFLLFQLRNASLLIFRVEEPDKLEVLIASQNGSRFEDYKCVAWCGRFIILKDHRMDSVTVAYAYKGVSGTLNNLGYFVPGDALSGLHMIELDSDGKFDYRILNYW